MMSAKRQPQCGQCNRGKANIVATGSGFPLLPRIPDLKSSSVEEAVFVCHITAFLSIGLACKKKPWNMSSDLATKEIPFSPAIDCMRLNASQQNTISILIRLVWCTYSSGAQPKDGIDIQEHCLKYQKDCLSILVRKSLGSYPSLSPRQALACRECCMTACPTSARVSRSQDKRI